MNRHKKTLLLLLASVAVFFLSPFSAFAQNAAPPAATPTSAISSGPRIWLQANQPLPVQHVAASRGTDAPADVSSMANAQPVSLVSGDLDGDGFEDLVVGYSTGLGGYVSIHRGNIDAFAPQSDASFQAIGRGEFPSPFQLQAQTFSVPVRPDFIALGDFTGNGNRDLAVAANGSKSLFILPGDGKGNFGAAQMVNVPGGITSMAAGTLGQTGILVVGGSRSLMVYVPTAQGLTALASYPVTAPVTNILFGDFGDPGPDVAFLSGGKVQILRSATMQVNVVSLPVTAKAFALGAFIYDRNRGSQIALVAPDGSVQIAVRNEFDPRVYTLEEFQAMRQANLHHQPAPAFVPVASFPVNGWRIAESFPGAASMGAGQVPVMFRTRASSNGADDVMVLNAFSGQLTLISHADGQLGAQTYSPGQVSLRPYTGTPIAALPLRINVDGRPGVMALHQGEIAPSMIMPIPDPTFTVNTTNDTLSAGACAAATPGQCSLREAIIEANATAGTDTIMVPAGTYTLTRARIANNFTGQQGTLEVTDSVNIIGGGQATTVIQGGTLANLSDSVDKVMSFNEDIAAFTNATVSISNLTIQNGHNRGNTSIQDGWGGAFDFDTGTSGNNTLTVTNVTLNNNTLTDGEGGGFAIFNTNAGTGGATFSNCTIQNNIIAPTATNGTANGGAGFVAVSARMTMTGCTVSGNQANSANTVNPVGGALELLGQLGSPQIAIHNSTITNNSAGGEGGGIFNTATLLIDQGSIISNNTAGTGGAAAPNNDGGGLWFNGNASSISKVAFTGNSAGAANGNGGGIFANSSAGGGLTVSFSRFAGNSAHSGANLALKAGGAGVTAQNNWWGTNAAGSSIEDGSGSPATSHCAAGVGQICFDPFIVLTHTGSPDKIRINQSSALTGTMANDNHGNAVGLANLTEIIGLPITFDGAVLGTIPQAQPETLNASAQATATFNAGGTSGFGTANATVDQAVVAVNSNLISAATEAGTTATITTVGAIGFSAGDFVRINGVGVAGYNSSPATQEFKVLSTPTATSFTYTADAAGLGPSSGGTVNAGIIILEPPSITKSFGPKTIQTTGGTGANPKASTITFSITNGNIVPINASFTDNLPTDASTVPGSLVVAATPNVVNNCGGTVTATAGSSTISFTNAALPVGTCTITVDVSSTVDDIYSNSVTINSTDAGNGNTASDSLNVINPPTSAKAFGAATIPLNGTTSLTITVSSTNQNQTLSGVSFADALPAGLVVATPSGVATTCTGTPTAAAGSSSVSLTGASLAPGASCTVSVNVQGTTAGVKNNSVAASDTTAGTSNTANASLTVVGPPTISKAFGAASIPLNGSTSLSFTINNPNTTVALTGVGFSDTLPAGLIISTPNGLTGSCGGGTITATQNTNVISLSGGTLAASGSCTFSVNVTGTAAGAQNNTTGNVTSTEGGTGGSASASITVEAPPTIAKAFNPGTIALNATTSLTFTITNPAANVDPLAGVAFTDTLPTGLTVANSTSTVCGGTLTTTAPTGISLTGATVAVNSNCQFSVTVTGAVSGQYTNTTGNVTSTNGGTGNTASANLTVASPPSITKQFTLHQIPLNGTTTLTFNITNPNAAVALSGIAFTDTLPAGLIVASTPNLTNTCNGTATAVGGSSSVSLSAGTLAASASCSVSVSVQGTTAGAKNNSVQVTSTEGGTGNTANDTITVIAPLTIAKAFNPTTIALNATSSLQFTITNPAPNAIALTGVGFTDTLPAGLTVANSTATVCGGTLTTTAPTGISLTGATVAAGGQCQFSVTVTGATAGAFTNTTGAVTSNEGGTGNTATANLTVVAPPSIAKAFNPSTISLNATTSLTFTITNPAANTVAENGVAFTDTLPTGLTVATSTSTVCGGTLTTTAPTSISLTGATIAVNSNCQFSVTVTGAASGQYTNTTGNVTSTNGGTGNTASANLTVASAPSITKAFGAASIPLNGTTSLTFTIQNPNTGLSLSGLAFTDNLPAGLIVASTPNLTNTCGGTATAAGGSSSVSLSGGTLAASASCTVSVNAQGTTPGVKNNSVTVTSTEAGTGNTSNASITVASPPTIAKVFGAASIPLNGSTSLSFTISNPNSITLTGIGFSDTLPAGLIISTPNGLTGSCGGGTITATQNTNVISLSGATLTATTSCTFSINVTGTAPGAQNNTTSAVTSTEGGTGGTASASISVEAPPVIAKAFNPAAIALNATTSLTFTITNPAANVDPLAGVAFTDTLPVGLTVASGTSTVCGGTLTTTAPTGISLTGATVAVNSNCQFSVTVTGAASGQYTNTTGNVTSTNGGTGNTASANLSVASPVSIAKAFGAATIPVNGVTSLTFSISNPNSNSATGIAFADSLPAGLIVATPSALSNTCGGTATATAGSGSVSLSGGTLSATASCMVSVNIQGATAGVKSNSVTVSSTEGGTGNTSNATITVVAPAAIMKAFGAASIPLAGSTSLSFTINNPNTTVALTGVGFTDTLPTGLVISTPNGLTGSCGGGIITATQNTNAVSLSGATLAANSSCTFSVNVTGTTAGIKNNTTSSVASNEGGAGGAASASIIVVAPPSIAKVFNPNSIAVNATTSLDFTITNPAVNTVALTGVAFTDTLPATLTVANGSSTVCGGTLTTSGGNTISLSGATIAAGGNCAFSVTVTATQPGSFTNTTGNVTSTNGGTGNTASATLTVNGVTVSPASIDFGDVDALHSVKATVTVTNSGNSSAPLNISVTPGTGANAHNFSSSTNCPNTLAAHKSCTVTVTFFAAQPHNSSGVGISTATLNVTSGSTSQHVPLQANVIDPEPHFNPDPLSFGTHTVNSMTTQTVTVSNVGLTPLVVHNVSISGENAADFKANNQCTSPVAPGGTCQIHVTFTPKAKGSREASLVVSSNDGTDTIELSGVGK